MSDLTQWFTRSHEYVGLKSRILYSTDCHTRYCDDLVLWQLTCYMSMTQEDEA